jgi:hypothetical protein
VQALDPDAVVHHRLGQPDDLRDSTETQISFYRDFASISGSVSAS